MTNATNTTQPTATATFAARRADLARLLDVLQQEVERWDREQAESPQDWGYAGQIGEVRVLTITDKQFERMRVFWGKLRKTPELPPRQLELF